MIAKRPRRAIAVLLVAGTVACTAAVPAPSPRSDPRTPASTNDSLAESSVASPSPSPSPSEPEERAGPLGQEIEIGTIDPDQTPFMSAFASDGDSIYFGSGAADGVPEGYAPDLWRYAPGADAPELVWSNPARNRTIAVIAGDLGTVAFAEMDGDGERDWNLWLAPDPGAEPILLDSHPGDENVSGLLPSMSVYEDRVAWTAFDGGPEGSVSQMLVAAAPDWTPVVLQERDAQIGELWLPSLRGTSLAYCEVTYNADRTHDQRHVYLTDVLQAEPPRQLDSSGRATMPQLVNDGVIWKETDPGFNMFNWGHLVYWNRLTEETRPIASRLQPDVNNPSAGERFIAVFGYDSAVFEVYDVDRMRWRLIDRYDVRAGEAVYRAHLGGQLLAWLESKPDVASGALRWAFLPVAGGDKLLDP